MMLTQKETTLLNDLISHEKLCIEKYSKYESEANDPQLKQIFQQLGQMESQHLNTLTQIQSGSVPSMNAGWQGNAQQAQAPMQTYTAINAPDKEKDKFLCSDLLSTEKHVSSVYDTCIFEFRDVAIRDALNHIQKEEQEHGQKLYQYMATNGMYSTN